jgi:hypothetical protein
MSDYCPECGAPVPEGGSCRENFHALLLLESQVPGGPGALPHFYAVACYGLQHPDSMNYTAEALTGLRAAVADVLDGRIALPELRRRTRRSTDGAVRVTRRAGEPPVAWHRGAWPITVANVCAEGVEGYGERVVAWARAVRDTLDTEPATLPIGAL